MNQKAIARIRKLLALAASPSANEAGAALAKAQALMLELGVTEADVALAAFEEKCCPRRATRAARPPAYLVVLAKMVAGAFGCRPTFDPSNGRVSFCGRTPRPEISCYAFDVLARQLSADRATFLAGRAARWKRTNRIARADRYAEGWVLAARAATTALLLDDRDQALLDAWMARRFGDAPIMVQGRHREATDRLGWEARNAGDLDGRRARLDRPVGSDRVPPKAITCDA